MPVPIKIMVSIAAFVLAMILFYVDYRYLGDTINPATKWVALLLGPLMVGAIWVFPEAKKGDVQGIRKESAARNQSN